MKTNISSYSQWLADNDQQCPDYPQTKYGKAIFCDSQILQTRYKNKIIKFREIIEQLLY